MKPKHISLSIDVEFVWSETGDIGETNDDLMRWAILALDAFQDRQVAFVQQEV